MGSPPPLLCRGSPDPAQAWTDRSPPLSCANGCPTHARETCGRDLGGVGRPAEHARETCGRDLGGVGRPCAEHATLAEHVVTRTTACQPPVFAWSSDAGFFWGTGVSSVVAGLTCNRTAASAWNRFNSEGWG